MSQSSLSDLLRTYVRLADEEVDEDWAAFAARWADLVPRLHSPPVGDLSAQVAKMPYPPLLIALGHHLDGDDVRAVETLRSASAALWEEARASDDAASAGAEASLLRGSRAVALAVFLAHFGAWRDAAEVFAGLTAGGWPFSLADVAIYAQSLIGVGRFDDALNVALGGVQELQRRRTALTDTSLRLNFGGPIGYRLSRVAATAALNEVARERDSARRTELANKALALLDFARDPLLAETVHTVSRAPILGGARQLIRESWAAEAAAFQWRELLCQALTEHGRTPDAEVIEERLNAAEAKARMMRSTLARATPSVFSSFFAPGRSILRSPVDGDVLAEAQQHVPKGTAVLGFEVLEDDVVGWALTPDGVWTPSLETSPQRLTAQAASVLAACAAGTLTSNSDLAPLASTLLGWADGLLQRTERILIVPTGPLRTIPFTVLPWRGSPLVATHTCSVLPTLGVLADLANRTAGDLRQAGLISFGNPIDMRWTSPTGTVVPLEPLRRSGEEAMKVARLARERGADYSGVKATRKAALDALRTADIVHFAAHAVFCEEAPLFSAILLAHGEQLSAIDLIATDAACDLVVASACSTGEGAVTAGDDVLGLSRGLLACGARAAIVSLWPVDDRRALELMVTFYRELFKIGDPALALRLAQKTFLDHSGGFSGNEQFWAPFVLVGL